MRHATSLFRAMLFLLGVVGCRHPAVLPGAAEARLLDAADPAAGRLVYEGTVVRRGTDTAPLFHYQRRVVDLEAGQRSTHLTREPSGAPVVLQQADHTPAYRLLQFQEIHAQQGRVGRVDVDAAGTATYQTQVNGRVRTRVERPGDPLQVGPTLFGYVREHWDELMAGAACPIRFVVLARRRSYRFALTRVDGAPGTLTLAMVPRDALVRWMVPSSELVFDAQRDIVRYSGLVPPMEEVGRRLERLDATVTYVREGPYR